MDDRVIGQKVLAKALARDMFQAVLPLSEAD
jgi:hypothetical protein